ncbi:MAG: 50S ribosomal subunit protein L5 [Candidatus Westeberhardia cardiocondylae]|nr:50S ribosomal subunit protein L5 [Candidatus Westeberhardia cardiocondylae]
MTTLLSYYRDVVVKKLLQDFKYISCMQVPSFKKITINMGLGLNAIDKKILREVISDISLISGQKPIVTKARRSISNFKIRKGFPVGCKTTLRGRRMWDFFEKFVYIVVPRIRDFRGFSVESFDGYGNYNIGVSEHIIFPEINYDTYRNSRGLDIAITTTARSNREGYALFKYLNFPFSRKD